MNCRYKVLLAVALLLLFLPTSSFAVRPPIPEMPSHYVVDLADIISDNHEMRLNGYLQELEQKTTAQMIILTVASLEGESIFDLSLHIAHDKWILGQKGKDNGVLLMVSLEDRKYWIQVGYGLESILPDSLVGSIGRQYLVPYFKKNDYSKGITASSLAVIHEIASSAGVEITGMPKVSSSSSYNRGKGKNPGLLGGIFSILFFIGLIYLFIRNPRLFMLLLFMNMMGGGRRDHWGGGGGFGSGGFGGFGGGGGGGFGGGGAGGGW